MGGQHSTYVSGQIIRIIALKNRALYQYGVGGGGFVDKKRYRQPPLSIVDVGGVSYFFIRRLCKI